MPFGKAMPVSSISVITYTITNSSCFPVYIYERQATEVTMTSFAQFILLQLRSTFKKYLKINILLHNFKLVIIKLALRIRF